MRRERESSGSLAHLFFGGTLNLICGASVVSAGAAETGDTTVLARKTGETVCGLKSAAVAGRAAKPRSMSSDLDVTDFTVRRPHDHGDDSATVAECGSRQAEPGAIGKPGL